MIEILYIFRKVLENPGQVVPGWLIGKTGSDLMFHVKNDFY